MAKGSLHPSAQILRVAVAALGDMGFDIVDSPEVDTPWYNFDSLRMHQDHPARQNHASFWLTNGQLLRTHTTNSQLHTTDVRKPPMRIMCFGPCYRRDATDATHDVVFNQIDAFAIDEGLTLGNLISVLETFIIRLFGNDVKYRLRPHNFPFTEPSVEVDIWHNGKWMELLGSGMIHPEVLTNMGIDPKRYSGFAFGIGFDRIALAKWGIEDLRLLRSNKLPFLRQFRNEA